MSAVAMPSGTGYEYARSSFVSAASDTRIVGRIYCTACNESFSAASLTCPRCGMSGRESPSTVDQTVLMDAAGAEAETEDDIDHQLEGLLSPGDRLHIYECHRLLGRGGMGVVYLAQNSALERQVALKVLSPRKISRDVDYVRRFETEGRAAAALVHSNVVTTHAIGIHGGRHFLEMEYIPGRSLQREIDSFGPLGPLRATRIAAGIAGGLSMAHKLGIVHSDLKPDNVLLTPADQPKLVDFGLAKMIRSDTAIRGKLAGTPHYMAPELFEGAAPSPAADVFALGVCYYQMMTGRFPFEGTSMSALMNAILTKKPVGVRRRNPKVSLEIAECLSLMLARDPSRRPADGAAARMLLQAVLGASRDLDSLVRDAFFQLPCAQVAVDGPDRFEVTVQLKGERRQRVFVENSNHSVDERLLLIYSVCCPAEPGFYEQALRLNADVQHGGISIRDIDGVPHFVMLDTYPRGTVDPDEVRRSVLEVATHADSIEHLLTGNDIH